jgi:hypothetical protein
VWLIAECRLLEGGCHEPAYPGPTPLPPDVLAAMSQQMIDHRGPEFEAMMGEVTLASKHSSRRSTIC